MQPGRGRRTTDVFGDFWLYFWRVPAARRSGEKTRPQTPGPPPPRYRWTNDGFHRTGRATGATSTAATSPITRQHRRSSPARCSCLPFLTRTSTRAPDPITHAQVISVFFFVRSLASAQRPRAQLKAACAAQPRGTFPIASRASITIGAKPAPRHRNHPKTPCQDSCHTRPPSPTPHQNRKSAARRKLVRQRLMVN